MPGLRFFSATLLTLILAACSVFPTGQATPAVPTEIPTPADPGLLAADRAVELRQRIPQLAARDDALAAALEKRVPVLELQDGLNDDQRAAQSLALTSPAFLQYTRDPSTGAPLRGEIFGIYPLRESDLTPTTETCRQSRCLRVELYNYALNVTSFAVVDLARNTVVNVVHQPDTQPDVPPHLTELATLIASNSDEVARELGGTPSPGQAVMPNIKTSLSESKCERSKHLCVAPTFLVGDRALWAIVDLTDGVLVGARWTNLGEFSGQRLTEKQLENDVVSRGFCEQETALERDGWSMRYMLTSSDGLRISEVSFQGSPVLRSAKLVDWHVTYSQLEGFGYSDAIGCTVFSQAAVIAIGPPRLADLSANGEAVGFTLTQNYWSEFWPQPCNYNYEQTYEFYRDGRFRVKAASLGRGCGDDGMYRPVFRIAPAGTGPLAQWDGAGWKEWSTEGWAAQADTASTPEGYQFRVGTNESGYYLEPANGQFGDGGRGDSAYIYVTRTDPSRDEGESDLITIGPCCNEGYRQGPEKFIESNPEPITGGAFVIWYVAQLKNEATPGSEYCWANSVLEDGIYTTKIYPCFAGPMFVPVAR
jgi:hypothetical protein